MKTSHIVLLFFLCSLNIIRAQGLRFYGDLLLSRGIENYAKHQGAGPIQDALYPFITKNAIHIVNLEGALGDKSDCAKSHDPCFAIEAELLSLIKGFDVVSLENNHSLDIGLEGLSATIQKLKKMNIVCLGGKNYSTLLTSENGNIGIIALTDVVNSAADCAFITMANSPEVIEEIKRLDTISTIVVIYVHWGRELLPIATERMKGLAHKFIDAGADIIVGTHPHVIGPVACIKGKPVVYSLGNFLFDQKYEDTKRGAVLDCDIRKEGRLTCTLSKYTRQINSYHLQHSTGTSCIAKNKILANCDPIKKMIWTGVFTQDKRQKRLIMKKKKPKSTLWQIEMYDLVTQKLEIRTPPMPINKLQPVDLNNDGISEIMLIQTIYSSFDKENAKRVYIYSLDSGFHALWRGTALSRPLLDALFVTKESKKPLLVALHSADSFLLRNTGCRERTIMVYKWNGFGFTGIKEFKVKNDCDDISYSATDVYLLKKGNIAGLIPMESLTEKFSSIVKKDGS